MMPTVCTAAERARDLLADRDDASRASSMPSRAEQRAQVLADEQLHQQVVIAGIGRDEVLDLDDVGMTDLVDRARFVEEARDVSGVAESGCRTLSAILRPSETCTPS